MTKYLIVNADDFGLTESVNQGITKAFREGIVRSTSIMPVGKAYDDAVKLAKENPGLDIGIHLCLTQEKPVLAKNEIGSLLSNDGNFFKTPTELIVHYLFCRTKLKEIQRELDAQIRKVLDSGIKVTHLDSHDHIHMFPPILNIVARLAKQYGILYVRYPYERLVSFNSNVSRHFIGYILIVLCFLSKQIFKKSGILKTDYFYGFLNSGHLSEQNLMQVFKKINNGITEIICHPGVYDEEAKRYNYWKYEWDGELKALTSPNIKKIIKDLSIQLVNFREIL